MRLSAFLTLTTTAPTSQKPDPVPSLKGESADQRFPDRIEVLSYDYRLHYNSSATDTQPPTVPGLLYIVKPVDAASPLLFQNASLPKSAQANNFTYAILSVCRHGLDPDNQNKTEVYWRIRIKNPWVVSVSQVGDPGIHKLSGRVQDSVGMSYIGPLEQVAFWGDEVEVEYEPDVASRRAKAAAIKIQAAARGMLARREAERERWAKMAEVGLFGNLEDED